MTTPLPEGTITLRDGRRLAYAEYGDPHGKPIFFFHGTPGSRLFHHPDASIAASSGARIIAVDRPGFGRSDFKPGRTLLDWPNDVVQLADAINIDRFAVMGYSGGGPYAAVCASSIPERLTAAGLVSSVAPMDNPQITRGMHGIGHTYFSLERHLPPLAKLGARLMCTTWRHNPDLYFKAQLNGLHDSKEAQAAISALKPILTADFQEAVRAGTDGITWDLEILTRPWGFPLHVISMDVFLWHGENDTQAPLAMGKRLAGAIPHCCATFFPREGHWAIYGHWQEILTVLLRAEAPARLESQPTTIAIAPEAANPAAPVATLPVDSGSDIVDTPSDSVQGLQPSRPASDVTPTTATESAAEAATEETAAVAEAPSAVSPEPEPMKKAPKPVSKKTTKHNVAAVAEPPPVVTPEPEAAQEAPKTVSKKAAKHSTLTVAETPTATPEPEPAKEAPRTASKKPTKRNVAAVAEAPPVVTPEPEVAQESPKPVSKKAAKRGTPIIAETPTATPEPEPAAEAPRTASKKSTKRGIAAAAETSILCPEPEPVQKPASRKTAKRGAKTSSDSLPDAAAKPKPVPEKVKATARRTAKTKAGVVELAPMAATEASAAPAELAEPTPAKPSSGRKNAKEAVLV